MNPHRPLITLSLAHWAIVALTLLLLLGLVFVVMVLQLQSAP